MKKGMLLAAVVFLFGMDITFSSGRLSERIEQQETMLQQLVAMNARLKSAAPDIIAARKIPARQRQHRYRGSSATALPHSWPLSE